MTFGVAGQNALLARNGFEGRWLMWVRPWDLGTGVQTTFGIWSGEYTATFTIDGGSRTYFAAPGAFMPDALEYAPGTDARTQSASISLTPDAVNLLRGYRVTQAPVELHLALMNPQSGALIDTSRRFKGTIDRVSIPTAALGGPVTAKIEMVSSMRALTRTVAVKKSDTSQQARSGDRFRRYGSIASEVQTEWIRE